MGYYRFQIECFIFLFSVPERPKRLLVFVNPVSGKKNGLKVFQSQAEPFFSLCEVTVDLVGKWHPTNA